MPILRYRGKHYCGSPNCTSDWNCPENDVCMCGSEMAYHDMYSGHFPTSMHEYYRNRENQAEED